MPRRRDLGCKIASLILAACITLVLLAWFGSISEGLQAGIVTALETSWRCR